MITSKALLVSVQTNCLGINPNIKTFQKTGDLSGKWRGISFVKKKVKSGIAKIERNIKICQMTKDALLFLIKASPRAKANTPIKIELIANFRLSLLGLIN